MSIVETAKKWVGYLEHETNDLLRIYTANVGEGNCTTFSEIITKHYRYRNFTGLPWCAVFIHAVFIEALGVEQAREILGKPHPGTRVLARRMKRKGLLRDRDYIPQPGDLIFFANVNTNRIGHCGIVEKVVGDTIVTIEGNTVDPTGHFDPSYGGAVAIRERSLSDPRISNYAELKKGW